MALRSTGSLESPNSGFNVEEGAHNRSNWNTAYLLGKWQGGMARTATGSPDTSDVHVDECE
jgi:hypothetical protein